MSLGGGISYNNIALRKIGGDLTLELGGSDRITLKGWYAATPVHSVLNLQTITESMAAFNASSSNPRLNKKIENFDFQTLVSAYDSARAANANLVHWSVMGKLLDAHLSSSDDSVLGGDLAYQYGHFGNLANVGMGGAQTVVGSAQFGLGAQLLQTPSTLQQGLVRLV